MAPLYSLLARITAAFASPILGETPPANSTIYNPMLPGFHPDPSCIFVPSWNATFFCASSSFNAFPGIPIHASQDLQNWRLIGHVLNRRSQLPRLAETNRSTSGIWAPTLRFHDGTFWLVTTLVEDDRPQSDESRWDNIIFGGRDPYSDASWSDAVHFNYTGYDAEPFWDVDGKAYLAGAHAWQVGPYIQLAEAELDTGKVGEWQIIWNGTGGMAPEGPHIYRKDGWYYLLAAEGGTGLGHMVTMARSKNIRGPYESNPANPVLTSANTTSLFQTVGHADLFQDGAGNWWGVALSTRSGPNYINYPMGRETVLTAVRWPQGEFPVWSPIEGEASAWPLPGFGVEKDVRGVVTASEDITTFPNGSSLPPYFTYWRYPSPTGYAVSPPERPGTLRLSPSVLNLTALNGNYAGLLHGPDGQTFVGRRQQDTLFTFRVDVAFAPDAVENEVGVSAFLTQNRHLDLGVVLLPAGAATGPFPGVNASSPSDAGALVPHVRFRGFPYAPVPAPVVVPLPPAWRGGGNGQLDVTFEIRAVNFSHYAFSIGPAGRLSELRTVITASNDAVSWGFTGVLLGAYATRNGGNGTAPAYISRWQYLPEGQFRS